MAGGQKIIDKFMSNVGLVSNVFGKYTDQIVFNQRKEKAKLLLDTIYGYEDIYSTFPQEVDEGKTLHVVKILNQYYEQRNAEGVEQNKPRD